MSWVLSYLREIEMTKEPDLLPFNIRSFQECTCSSEGCIRRCLLPLGRDENELRILDVGYGLGFLSCVSAKFYKNALITGVDTFEHASLKRSSVEEAKENVRILGFSDRIDFKLICKTTHKHHQLSHKTPYTLV